jgi:hypothetical protein
MMRWLGFAEIVGKRGHVIDLCLDLTRVRDVFADMPRSYLSETTLFAFSNFLQNINHLSTSRAPEGRFLNPQ